jgi:hypothetical protein
MGLTGPADETLACMPPGLERAELGGEPLLGALGRGAEPGEGPRGVAIGEQDPQQQVVRAWFLPDIGQELGSRARQTAR